MRRLPTLPLSVRIPLIVSALMIAVGAIASERVLARLAETQERQLRDLAALYLDGLSVAILPAALRGDVWETYDALERATRKDRSLRAIATTVVMAGGDVLASSDPAQYPTGSLADAPLLGAPVADVLTLSGEAPSVQVQAPLLYQGERIGGLHAELDVTDLLAERQRALLYLVLGNAAATLLLTVAGYLILRRMLRPISLLVDHMHDDGGAGARPIPEREIPRDGHEIATLFRTYNALVRAERDREETARRAAEQQRLVSLGRLAASVAHEINNPLGGMLNTVDTMRRHGDRPGVMGSSVALLERGLLGIRNVAQALLKTHRADRAQLSLSADDFDDLRLLVSPEIRRRAQRLDWQVVLAREEDLPLSSGPVRQIALNLLLNASAAAGTGGRLGFEARAGAQRLHLLVTDCGPGLDEAARRALLSGAVQQAGGGVGLGIVYDRVQGLSGAVEIERTADGETVIEVTIPLGLGDAEAA